LFLYQASSWIILPTVDCWAWTGPRSNVGCFGLAILVMFATGFTALTAVVVGCFGVIEVVLAATVFVSRGSTYAGFVGTSCSPAYFIGDMLLTGVNFWLLWGSLLSAHLGCSVVTLSLTGFKSSAEHFLFDFKSSFSDLVLKLIKNYLILWGSIANPWLKPLSAGLWLLGSLANSVLSLIPLHTGLNCFNSEMRWLDESPTSSMFTSSGRTLLTSR